MGHYNLYLSEMVDNLPLYILVIMVDNHTVHMGCYTDISDFSTIIFGRLFA